MTPKRNSTSSLRRGLIWVTAGAATFGIGLGAAGLASAASSTADSSSTVAASTVDTTATADTSATTATTAPVDTVITSDAASSATPTPPAGRPQVDPASVPNGPGETVLTGDDAAKVTAAAQAAEPGATVIRVETDSSGHAYEAHVQLADGTYTTLYFDANFAADGTDVGFGPAPQGAMGDHDGDHQGPPPAAAQGDSGTTATTAG